MSYYVITKVRVNPRGDVIGAWVHHLADMPADKRMEGLGDEVEMPAQDVADLMLAGDQVYVGIESLEKGYYTLTDEVRSSDDDEPCLQSFDESGETSSALSDLPRLA